MYFTYPNYFIKGSDNVVPMFNDSWSRTRNVLKNTNFKQYVEMFPDSEELKYMQTAGNGGTAQGRTPNNDMKHIRPGRILCITKVGHGFYSHDFKQ